MSKSLKRVGILLMVFIFSLSLTAFASSDEERFIIEDDRVLDTETNKEYGSAFKYNGEGEIEEVNLEELKELLEKESQVDIPNEFQKDNTSSYEKINSTPASYPYLFYLYTQSGTLTSYGNRIAISAWVACPSGGDSCTITSTTGWTVSESFSVGVDSGGAKSAIRGSASFTWNSSVTKSTSYQLPIQPGKRGRMMFLPEYNYTYGTLSTYIGGTLLEKESVSAESPKKVAGTGEPDGTYFIEFSN